MGVTVSNILIVTGDVDLVTLFKKEINFNPSISSECDHLGYLFNHSIEYNRQYESIGLGYFEIEYMSRSPYFYGVDLLASQFKDLTFIHFTQSTTSCCDCKYIYLGGKCVYNECIDWVFDDDSI